MDQFRQLSVEDQRKIRDIAAATNRRNRLAREKRDTEIAARREEAWIEVHRLLHRFREIDPNIDHLILFGSLARGDMKRPDFDIDIAVRSERYLQILGLALDSDFKVDLVDLPNASTYITAAIKCDGIEVRHGE